MPDHITPEELIELRKLLGKWISHFTESTVGTQRDGHALIQSLQTTYAVVNATIQHAGGPPE